MSLPYFYVKDLSHPTVVLDEDTSKYVVQVLRMQAGEPVLITDGLGNRSTALITDNNRKRCTLAVQSAQNEPARRVGISIAISLLKNTSRFEWFLEKATELGVSEIIPLLCERTEKEKFRSDRLNGIMVSAMLQSQQCWLPLLTPPMQFEDLAVQARVGGKFIAHCVDADKDQLQNSVQKNGSAQLIQIGPEGDFTPKEISIALANNFLPVSLGRRRLRTETAGLAAAVLLTTLT